MASVSNLLFFSFFLVSAAFLPALLAENEPQIMDEYWKERAAAAFKEAQRTYNPNPEEVTDSVNLKVGKFITGTMDIQNSTRRHLLKRYNGPCMTTNPIDQCWRCDPNWAKNRKRLADCAIGFGRNTVGGKHGRFYIVTDPSDDNLVNPKPGTLRYAAIQTRPLWITFSRSMIITLKEELLLTSDKTIDGRGSNVHIAYGAGITLQFVKNIIIHNIHVHDIIESNGGLIRDSTEHIGFRTMSDGDGISLFGACNVWIDHVSMYKCNDGLIDAIMGSTGITISNSHFTDHNQVMLFGANKNHEQDKFMQITVAFNHFGRGLVQRMPRCRFGFVHVVNNDYTHWLMYAIGGSSNPTIISQGNRFIAPPNKAAKEVTNRYNTPEAEWLHWTWRSEGDLMMNGAFFVQSGNPNFDSKSREGMIQAKPGHMVTSITRFAGTLRCTKGFGC